MTTYCLEMRSTAKWEDCRYREYTTSAKKAELFKTVPKVQFTDSGHGIVPHVHEHSGRRFPRNMMLADHVQEHIAALGRQAKASSAATKAVDLRPPSPDFRVVPVRVLQSAYDRIDAMLAGVEPDLRAANSVRIELRHLIKESYALSSRDSGGQ